MTGQQFLFAALGVAVLVLAGALVATLMQLKKTIRQMEERLDQTLRQAEMTAEDLRKTNAVVRDILVHVERVTANAALLSDGARTLRRTIDSASAGVVGVVLPVMGTISGLTAGVKAFAGSIVNRMGRKEKGHV